MSKNALGIWYESHTIFSNRGIRGQSFEQFKTFEPNSRYTYELQELTTDCANQLRSSRTKYDSATNPNIYQFVAICGIRGLCGIGVWARQSILCILIESKTQRDWKASQHEWKIVDWDVKHLHIQACLFVVCRFFYYFVSSKYLSGIYIHPESNGQTAKSMGKKSRQQWTSYFSNLNLTPIILYMYTCTATCKKLHNINTIPGDQGLHCP